MLQSNQATSPPSEMEDGREDLVTVVRPLPPATRHSPNLSICRWITVVPSRILQPSRALRPHHHLKPLDEAVKVASIEYVTPSSTQRVIAF